MNLNFIFADPTWQTSAAIPPPETITPRQEPFFYCGSSSFTVTQMKNFFRSFLFTLSMQWEQREGEE
jgi:hypothetical protein